MSQEEVVVPASTSKTFTQLVDQMNSKLCNSQPSESLMALGRQLRMHTVTKDQHMNSQSDEYELPLKAKKRKREIVNRPQRRRLYCQCSSVCLNEDMIMCEQCENWFHPKCIGMSEKTFAEYSGDQGKSYSCDFCMILSSPI